MTIAGVNVTTKTITARKSGTETMTAADKPLRQCTEEALKTYFNKLNGHKPGDLYNLVLREVEEPLLRTVMDFVRGNQSHAASVLGINRGTLRKKLKLYRLI